MIGGMTDEPVAREVWKQARNIAAGDKAAVVQASALQVRTIQMTMSAKEAQMLIQVRTVP